ncbi:hypothetical protein LDENG_00067390 [Lucifuga dentata]|nr:hypothetical protein LDENG_00067390 [Lucifuga dentata]
MPHSLLVVHQHVCTFLFLINRTTITSAALLSGQTHLFTNQSKIIFIMSAGRWAMERKIANTWEMLQKMCGGSVESIVASRQSQLSEAEAGGTVGPWAAGATVKKEEEPGTKQPSTPCRLWKFLRIPAIHTHKQKAGKEHTLRLGECEDFGGGVGLL